MDDKLPAGWSAGELVGVGAPGVVVTLDCSGGETDIPDDQWCDGELVGVGAPGVVVTLDCSHWEQEPPAALVEPAGDLRPLGDGAAFHVPVEKPAG